MLSLIKTKSDLYILKIWLINVKCSKAYIPHIFKLFWHPWGLSTKAKKYAHSRENISNERNSPVGLSFK